MIYSLEDDPQIREMILYALRQSGYAAEGFADTASLWRALSRVRPALILLDIMLPDGDGMTVLQRLRQGGDTRDIPVIMLTAKGAEMDKVMGLNRGADDYITKPFSVLELIARVQALLRRAGDARQAQAIRAGELVLDAERHTVSQDGHPVEITRKEFELLHYLMRHPQVACTRERLLEAVWGDGYGGQTRTVDVHIQTLRQKLGAGGEQIETVWGIGYRFRESIHEKEMD